MSKSRRCYAIADYSQVGKWSDDGYAELNPRDQTTWAKLSVQCRLSHLRSLHVFDSLDDAMSYADDTALYNFVPAGYCDPLGVNTNKNARIQQPIVIEISVIDANKKCPVRKGQLKEQHIPFHWEPLKKYCTHPSQKEHTYTEIPNQPENYVVHQAWVKKEKFTPIRNTRDSYFGFFKKPLTTATAQVIALFDDYSNPGWFTFHWNRHHKDVTNKIIGDLKYKSSKDAFDYLMAARKKLIKKYKPINSNWYTYGYSDLMNGSFMRRIDFALTQLQESIDSQPQYGTSSRGLARK